MIIYKLTCKTGRIYYGSSTLTLQQRASKGWYKCACKDFDIEKMEVIEEIEGDDKQLLLERESYYIENYECVNKQTAKLTPEYKKLLYEKWYIKEKESGRLYERVAKSRDKIREEKRFNCNLCNLTFQSDKKLTRHEEGYRHKLKEECYRELGEDWREHYRLWKSRRSDSKRRKG